MNEMQIDRAITLVTQLAQNYGSLHVCAMDGYMMTCVTCSDAGCLVPIFFIRDLLQDSAGIVKGSSDSIVFAFVMLSIDKIGFWIEEEEEPCLRCDVDLEEIIEAKVFQLKDGQIAFDEQSARMVPRVYEKCEDLMMDGEVHFKVMQFDDLDWPSILCSDNFCL
jgi:hypothetical protein